MKLVLQRVTEGSVTIDGAVKGAIGRGFVALAGFGPDDDETVLAPMADKMLNLRVFEDENGTFHIAVYALRRLPPRTAAQLQRRGQARYGGTALR